MKYALSSFSIVAIALASAALADHHESATDSEPWFDMQGCACCKHMGENMDMMQDIKWENHTTKNGGMMTVVVPQQHKERWDSVCKAMHATGEKMQHGEDLPMCNFCQSWGELMQAGANFEEIKTDFGSVTLVTSDKPEVVEMIHQHFKKTQQAQQEMEAANSQQG